MADVPAAPAAVEVKQRPEASRQDRRKTGAPDGTNPASEARQAGKAGKAGKSGKPGKSFAASFLGKLAEQVKGKRPADPAPRVVKAPAGEESPAARLAGRKTARPRRRAALPAAAALPGIGTAKAVASEGPDERTAVKAAAGRILKAGNEPRVRSQLVIIDMRKAKPTAAAPAAEPAPRAPGETAVFQPVSRAAAAPTGEVALPSFSEQTARTDPGGAPPPQNLLRAWQEAMVPEVVKRTGIIVRDGGEGEIRLVLKPESLGSVRIRISINNNSVEGRIVVENNSVKELFDASLDNLKASLKQEGFQSASLEVAVGNQRNGQEAENRRPASPEYLREEAAEEFDRLVPLVWAGVETRVNLVV